MEMSSPDFEQNGQIPSLCGCDGEDLSPELHWCDLPRSTRELATTCEDPDAPSRAFTHWVVWGLEPNVASLAVGDVPSEARQGLNDFDRIGYGVPCPPAGHGPHRYHFTLLALSEPMDLPAGSTIAELRTAMAGHILDEAELFGTYAR